MNEKIWIPLVAAGGAVLYFYWRQKEAERNLEKTQLLVQGFQTGEITPGDMQKVGSTLRFQYQGVWYEVPGTVAVEAIRATGGAVQAGLQFIIDLFGRGEKQQATQSVQGAPRAETLGLPFSVGAIGSQAQPYRLLSIPPSVGAM